MAKQKKVTVDGTEYTLQHPSAYWFFEMTDRCKNANGILQTAKYSKELIENVIVQPKVTFDDFNEDIAGVSKLVQKIETFLSSK